MTFDFDAMYYGSIKRGDVFLCDLVGGQQPVVVLQDTLLNERLGTVVIVPVSLYNGERYFKNEVVLKAVDSGLGKDGLCSLFSVQIISRCNFRIKKGELSPENLQAMYSALDINLGRFRD